MKKANIPVSQPMPASPRGGANSNAAIIIVLAVILVIVAGLVVASLLRGEEDTWLCENGQWVKHGQPSAAQPTTGCGQPQVNEEEKQPNISIATPAENETVNLPILVSGQARVFENVVSVRLKSTSGEILYQDFATAQSPDMGKFGPYEKQINYLTKKPADKSLILEVYTNSAKDGSEIDLVSRPLILGEATTTPIKIFYNNNILDPKASCNKVFPVERLIAPTPVPARTALEFLLFGPTTAEKGLSFFTNINAGVKINSLTIEKGVAKVDFSEELQAGVGGSCRVTAIRAQITQTLMQFPTVKSVVISIGGKTADILQP